MALVRQDLGENGGLRVSKARYFFCYLQEGPFL